MNADQMHFALGRAEFNECLGLGFQQSGGVDFTLLALVVAEVFVGLSDVGHCWYFLGLDAEKLGSELLDLLDGELLKQLEVHLGILVLLDSFPEFFRDQLMEDRVE